MHYQVYRPHLSSYQDQNFFQQEKKVLEAINLGENKSGLSQISYGGDLQHSADPLILITNTHSRLEDLPSQICQRLALVIHPNSGYDNLSRDWSKKWQVPVVLGNPIRAQAVSEYVLSCLLHRFTPLPKQTEWDQNRRWSRGLLKNQKALLLGLGHVGKILAPTLQLLCRELQIYDPNLNLSELTLQQADIVIVACDLNPTSQSLINQHFLQLLPSHFTLINPARGAIVDEASLLESLQKNPAAAAYLDVFHQEPYPNTFPQLPNLFCTSHQAGVFAELDKKILQFEESVVRDFIELNLAEFKA